MVNKSTVLLDIRPALDFQQGHLYNSINLSPNNISKYLPKLIPSHFMLQLIANSSLDSSLEEAKQWIEKLDYLLDNYNIEINNFDANQLVKSQTISATDFLKLEGPYTLLDVRHPDEITRQAPQNNLVNIPLEDLNFNLNSLNKEIPIYTLCGSGNRGTVAASFLAKEGFSPIIISGGMKAIQVKDHN